MKFRILVILLVLAPFVSAQLPNRVKKLEGLWAYKEGSGFEKWTFKDDVMYGESFRVNKLGDTLVAEKFEIHYINNRLVLEMEAYHILGDSLVVQERTFIGKKRKLEFTALNNTGVKSIHFKFGFLTRKRLKLFIHTRGLSEPQKLRLNRQLD